MSSKIIEQITRKKFLLNRLKIVTGAFLIAMFFSLVLIQKIFHEGFLNMFLLTWAQLEIFIWLGHKFFNITEKRAGEFKKQMVVRLLLFYLMVLIISALFFFGIFFIQVKTNGFGFRNVYDAMGSLEMKGFFTATFIGFAIGALVFFYSQWSDALKREQKLTQEKLILQYETLKKQVNPHFLFNSLNTLSSLVERNPVQSEKFISKLSAIYRYVLDNEEKELVTVADEMKFVNDYYYLQKIRDEDKIELKVEPGIADQALIVPVSLQLVVENALKHNSATRKNPLVIEIEREDPHKLVVRNNLQKKMQLEPSSGKGLKNLNERCRLILNREIEVQETTTEYAVKIPVKPNKP